MTVKELQQALELYLFENNIEVYLRESGSVDTKLTGLQLAQDLNDPTQLALYLIGEK